MDADQSGPDAETVQVVELYVKAGRDGHSIGGCPLCHRIAMILAVKAGVDLNSTQKSMLTFTVTPVNLARPTPDSFRKSINRLPAIVHDDSTLTDPDEIVAHLDCRFPEPPMGDCETGPAAEACRDVFSKFSFYIRDVAHSPAALIQELRRIDSYLAASGHRFLRGDERPDHLDCTLLPKLQHVRVAARALRGFDIPTDLTALWRYLGNAYRTREFKDTCPSDQEIVRHWLEKPECAKVFGKEKLSLLVDSAPAYSFEIPPEIAI